MRKLIYIFTILALTLLAVTIGCTPKKEKGTADDSVFTISYIGSLSISEPERALALIDTAEQRGLWSDFDVYRLRAIVCHNGMSDDVKALEYALKAYDAPAARNNGMGLLRLIEMIADLSYLNGDYPQSIRFCTEGIKLAQDSLAKSYEATLDFQLGRNMFVLDRPDEGFRYCYKAVDMLDGESKKSNTWETTDDYIYTLAILIGTLRNEGYFDKAIEMLPRYEAAVSRLETKEQIPEGLVDMRLASGYGMAAHLYAIKGKMDKAHEQYLKLCATDYARTPDASQLIIPYLQEVEDYRSALQHLQEEKKHWQANADTISYSYIQNHLETELAIYEDLGNLRSANRLLHTIQALNDTLRQRERQEDALELAEVYKTNKQAMQIKEQENAIRIRTLIIVFAALLLAVAVGFIIRILHDQRVILKKNHVMSGTIDELLTYKQELFKRQEENIRLRDELQQLREAATVADETVSGPSAEETAKSSATAPELTEKDRALYDRIDHEIVSRKLYLYPDFNKTELLKEIHVPANKFAALFKEFAGCSFSQYLQECRLGYAISLMRENPQWSMEAVAREAQMSNGAFYSQFKRKFGMKPSDYRKTKVLPEVETNE